MSRSEATILHADVDAFFAAVEQRDDPRLRGRPIAVGAGVVMACSYEAKARGVRGGMAGGPAKRLCPELEFVSPRFSAYTEASRAVFDVFRDTSPSVEGMSLEEAFLDVRGLEHIGGSPAEIGRRLRRRIRDEVGLVVTVGIAPTKVLAKMASRVGKPDGLVLVPPGRELEFLHPIPVEKVWGIGQATARKLHDAGVRRVADMAVMSEAGLATIVGKAAARNLHAIANNRDHRPVRTGRRRRSIGSQSARRLTGAPPEKIDAALFAVVERVTRRMRSAGHAGRTVVLRLRYADFTRSTRSTTLPKATASTKPVMTAARRLLRTAMPAIRERGLTLIGITVTNLDGKGVGVQLVLPLTGDVMALEAAIDEVRARYGPGAITRATLAGGSSVPRSVADERDTFGDP